VGGLRIRWLLTFAQVSMVGVGVFTWAFSEIGVEGGDGSVLFSNCISPGSSKLGLF